MNLLKQKTSRVPRTLFACVTPESSIAIFDINSNKPIQTISSFASVNAIAFLTENRLVIAHSQKIITIWDMQRKQVVLTNSLKNKSSILTVTVVSQSIIVFNTGNTYVGLWNIEKNTVEALLIDTYDLFRFDDNIFGLCETDCNTTLWDARTLQKIESISSAVDNEIVSADVWSPNQIIYSNDDKLHIYDVKEKRVVSTFTTDFFSRYNYDNISFLRKIDHNRVAIVLNGEVDRGKGMIWNLKTGKTEELFKLTSTSYSALVMKRSLMFYLDDDEKSVKIFDTTLMQHVKTFIGPFNTDVYVAVW
jgi:WD40 repeat protein